MFCCICEEDLLKGDNERYCYRCCSVERHRCLISLYKKNLIKNNIPNLKNKKILIVSEGKTSNGEYVETAYYFNKISDITTIDIVDHEDIKGNKTSFDIYESLENLKSFEDNTFDCIICNHILTAVTCDLTALSEITRVLKENSILFITDGIDAEHTYTNICPRNSYVQRYYNKNELIEYLNLFFSNIILNKEKDILTDNTCELIICQENKKYTKYGSTTPLCTDGWWKHIVVVFDLYGTGQNSIELYLKNLGYNILYADVERAKKNNKNNEYNILKQNYISSIPAFTNIKETAIIFGGKYSYKTLIDGYKNLDPIIFYYNFNLSNLFTDYPGMKVICTDINNDDFVTSVKKNELYNNRSNPKRVDIINFKNRFINTLKEHILPKSEENFMIYNNDNDNKYEKLSKFLYKDTPIKEFISSINSLPDDNIKLDLTDEQIKY